MGLSCTKQQQRDPEGVGASSCDNFFAYPEKGPDARLAVTSSMAAQPVPPPPYESASASLPTEIADQVFVSNRVHNIFNKMPSVALNGEFVAVLACKIQAFFGSYKTGPIHLEKRAEAVFEAAMSEYWPLGKFDPVKAKRALQGSVTLFLAELVRDKICMEIAGPFFVALQRRAAAEAASL